MKYRQLYRCCRYCKYSTEVNEKYFTCFKHTPEGIRLHKIEGVLNKYWWITPNDYTCFEQNEILSIK